MTRRKRSSAPNGNEPLRLFLSHAHSDKDVAEAIDAVATDAFRGLLKVFRSSDEGKSIEVGESIRQTVRDSLSSCVAAISLLSHTSVNRPWINIEFGALWMLDVPLIPVCFPDLKAEQLPIHFADVKVCNLGRELDCIALVKRLHGFVRTSYPIDLEAAAISRHGKSLHKRVSERLSARASEDLEEPPLPKRATVWLIGSYSGLRASHRDLITKLLPIIARGLVDLAIRVVSGESDMLTAFARHFRDATLATKAKIPNAITLSGRLRQRDARNLFRDAIGVVPTVAIVIGGGVARGRVKEEYDIACRAKIPVIPVPATGGAAAVLKSTARNADDLLPLLATRGRAVDVGDLAAALIKAVQRYAA